MAKLLKAGNLFDAWRLAVKTVYEEGAHVLDERGSMTKEVSNLIIDVASANTKGRQHPYWNGPKLEAYTEQLTNPDDMGFVYTYGNRFRAYFGVDQLAGVVDRLKNEDTSRRAIMVTYDPIRDTKEEEIPCIIAVDFKIRGKDLNTTAFWRSNDMWGAYYPNIRGIVSVSNLIAEQLGIHVGSLTTHAVSAHIYHTDFDVAGELARKSSKMYMK